MTAQAKTWPAAIAYLQREPRAVVPRRGGRHGDALGGGLPRGRRHPARARLVPAGRLPAERGALRHARTEDVPGWLRGLGVRYVVLAARDARLQLAERGDARARAGSSRSRACSTRATCRSIRCRTRARSSPGLGSPADVADAVADRRGAAARRDVPHRGALVAVLARVARLSQPGQGQDDPADDAARALRAADVPGRVRCARSTRSSGSSRAARCPRSRARPRRTACASRAPTTRRRCASSGRAASRGSRSVSTILTGRADDALRGFRVADAVRARADTVVPRGEHHVLRGAADVERERRAGDRDGELRAEDVLRRVDGLQRALRGRGR